MFTRFCVFILSLVAIAVPDLLVQGPLRSTLISLLIWAAFAIGYMLFRKESRL